MSKQFTFNPKLHFAIERFIDVPRRLVWDALTKPEHLKESYMPKAWGRVSRTEMDVRPSTSSASTSQWETVRSYPTSAVSWTLFRWSDSSGPPCSSPAIVRLSLTKFRSLPSLQWNPWEPALATSLRRCTGMKRTSSRQSVGLLRAPGSPSISSWSA